MSDPATTQTNAAPPNIIPNIDEALARILIAHLDPPADKLKPQAEFVADLGADSLDMIEIIMDIEAHYGVAISDDAAESVKTIADAQRVIDAAKGGQ